MVSELLKKYIWLIQTVLRAGDSGISLEELSRKWKIRFNSDYSRRTFNNHRAAVEEVFGIIIGCNRTTNCYFIRDYEDVSDENYKNAWLINTFTVNNILSLGKEKLAGRISVEDIPSGHLYLTSIMDAMIDGYKIVVSYQKYTSSTSSEYTIRPYAVKEAEKRWYIVGYCEEKQNVRVYGLDRIKSLKTTNETFEMPEGFNIDDLYATGFGIYLPEGPGKTITFRADATEARFLRDLPLHSSQKEEFSDGNFVTFSIFVCPNRNLIMEFCKRGCKLEVLSPVDVRNAVAEELKKAAGLYE